MYHILSRLALAAGLSLLLIAPAQAQGKKKDDTKLAMKQLLAKAEEEYHVFFGKRPDTTPDLWVAIKLETQVGKFDLAALHIKYLIEKKPAEKVDDELVQIEEVEGFSPFLNLKSVRQWNDHPKLQKEAVKNVEVLLDRLTAALNKRLGDPVRIRKFIDSLSAPTPEERAFAFAQLLRSRGRAAPYLLQELKKDPGSLKQRRLIDAMVKLDADVMPPLMEALKARYDDKNGAQDAQDADLRVPLLEVIRRRAEKRAIPYLWHLSSSLRYPETVRNSATATLAYLLETDPRHLPSAKVALTKMAENLYEHRVKFKDPQRIPIWVWLPNHTIDNKSTNLPASLYERVFGQRYAKQALDLDPSYRPAQLILLLISLDNAYKGSLDQLLTGKTNPGMDQMLASIDATLLIEALERGLGDHNLAIMLPLIKALGERGEVRAANAGTTGTPGPLVRALYYPDRRVQFAAANALLHMPSQPSPVASARVVEVLRRFIAASPTPKALIAFAPDLKATELRKQVKAAGFEPVVARNLKETFDALHQAADIDLILVHHAVGELELPYVLTQLRADRDGGLLPVLFVAPVKREAVYSRLERQYRNVWVLPEVFLGDKMELKSRLEDAIKLAAAPDSVLRAPAQQRTWLRADVLQHTGQKLSQPERKQFATDALDALWKMARGQIKGYDVRAAEPAIVAALASDETVVPALEILATFPGKFTQQRLANVVLDAKRGKRRVAAALALNKHVQTHGLQLSNHQVSLLRQLYATPGGDPNLHAQLAVLMGNLRVTAEQTGSRLYRFELTVPAKK